MTRCTCICKSEKKKSLFFIILKGFSRCSCELDSNLNASHKDSKTYRMKRERSKHLQTNFLLIRFNLFSRLEKGVFQKGREKSEISSAKSYNWKFRYSLVRMNRMYTIFCEKQTSRSLGHDPSFILILLSLEYNMYFDILFA